MNVSALKRRPRRFARLAGGLVFLTGALVLVGWACDLTVLQNIGPGWVRMTAAAALSFVLAGLGLWCASGGAVGANGGEHDLPAGWRRKLLWACGAAVAAIGILKMSKFLGFWTPAMDLLWFTDRSGLSPPTRVVPASAINLALLGCAIVLAGERRFVGIFQGLTLLGGVIGWLGLSHYLYGGEPLVPYTEMAVHTALAFIILSAGLLASRTDGGLMALLISDSLGGAIARRLVPAVVVLPILFGWLRLEGQRLGWFGTEAGVALA